MNIIDADELMEHIFRDKLESREQIAEIILNLQNRDERIPSQDSLIIKYPYLLSEKEADYFYKKLLAQKARGLVILPAGCEAVYIPKDCEVVIETEEEKRGENL